jgi:hypothetical protein
MRNLTLKHSRETLGVVLVGDGMRMTDKLTQAPRPGIDARADRPAFRDLA